MPMPDHYFTAAPQSAHRPAEVRFAYRGHALRFATDSGVFSRTELDRGSEELLAALPETLSGRVLDMGCGYGALGVAVGAAWPDCRVLMTDVNERAVALARQNAADNGVRAEALASDGYAALAGRTFDWILTNPPIRAGKRVIYRMFADAALALAPGGRMLLVIRKQQGAESAAGYLRGLYARVEVLARKGGYHILCASEPLESPQANQQATEK